MFFETPKYSYVEPSMNTTSSNCPLSLKSAMPDSAEVKCSSSFAAIVSGAMLTRK